MQLYFPDNRCISDDIVVGTHISGIDYLSRHLSLVVIYNQGHAVNDIIGIGERIKRLHRERAGKAAAYVDIDVKVSSYILAEVSYSHLYRRCHACTHYIGHVDILSSEIIGQAVKYSHAIDYYLLAGGLAADAS